MTGIRQKTINGLNKGDSFSVTRTFNQSDVDDFTKISRDDNPIHFDQAFVESKKMKAPICHGLLVASMLTEIGGQIGWLASKMDIDFLKPVYIGDTITCTLLITQKTPLNWATAKVSFTNEENEEVMTALLKGKLPNQNEIEILKTLV